MIRQNKPMIIGHFVISVQYGKDYYCKPKGDFSDITSYKEVELYISRNGKSLSEEYMEDVLRRYCGNEICYSLMEYYEQPIFPFVPTDLVLAVIISFNNKLGKG